MAQISLEEKVNAAAAVVQQDFGLQLNDSQLKIYPTAQWNEFCTSNGFDKTSEGIYIPTNHIAYINQDISYHVTNAFHELFGHGLFCEYSIIGKPLTKIVNQEEAKDYLYNPKHTTQQQFGLAERNIDNYEGFALWLESYLCKKTDNEQGWKLKEETLSQDWKQLHQFFVGAAEKMTPFGLVAQMGFPKKYTDETILEIAKKFYGNKFQDISCIIIYGSQKPTSDIDLFVISDGENRNYFNGWLDIFEVNKSYFEKNIALLDIALTDPLFSRRVIYEKGMSVVNIKEQLLAASITTEMITHAKMFSEKQNGTAESYPQDSREYALGKRYAYTFSQSAKQLAHGKKMFTMQEIMKVN